MRKEVRIAVGTPNGPRSTVWKFAANGADVYIFTRLLGADAKVSLHASGDCQWSGTGVWVKKDPARKNQDRHFGKWHEPRPFAGRHLHCFFMQFPAPDLHPIRGEGKLGKVLWLQAPPADGVLSLDCYFTGPSHEDPSLSTILPHDRLFSFHLSDGRWFVVQHRIADLKSFKLDATRAYIADRMRAAGEEPRRKQRAAVFCKSDGTACGLIELALV